MKILFAASECSPIVKVGGLGDVIGSLPNALKKLGVNVSIVIPFYKPIGLKDKNLIQKDIKVFFNQKEESFNLWRTTLAQTKIPVYLIENKKYLSSRGIYLEEDASSAGTTMESSRFLFFAKTVVLISKLLKVKIIHCHDWQTAIVPFLIDNEKENIKTKTVLTIHNLGYQGIFPSSAVNQLLGTKFSEKVNSLKVGIAKTDIITTVSPTYAKEILTKEFGFGLEKQLLKRKKELYGILNGLETKIWDPSTDKLIVKNYSFKDIEKKAENKLYLQKLFFKKSNLSIPLIAIVSRLAQQKGIDLVREIFAKLMRKNLQFVVLGKGYQKYENFFIAMGRKHPAQFKANIEFNEKLAHQIYAGSDIFLIPSLYEPCGLGQQIAMRYGTAPIGRAVGGIKDTIIPIKKSHQAVKGTGFLFKRYNSRDLLIAIENSLDLYQNKDIWRQIQSQEMKKDFSWKKAAKKYKEIYQKLFNG